MPVPIGATIVLSPQEGVNLIWGSAARVYNFFTQNDIQVTTAVYMANCSIVGGDSDGWRASLNAYHVIRQSKGFTLGSLTIGYPGRSIFSELLSSEYGTRWLGILVVASTMTDDIKGGRGLYLFMKQVASNQTSQLILGMQQCERIWTLARQLFADSPYWYEFLRIMAECANCVEIDVVSLCFLCHNETRVNSENFFITFMMAAYRLWELSQPSQMKGRKLWAQGSVGCGQLILYLTLVCGFHVTVRSRTQDAHFGGSESRVKVIMVIKPSINDAWVTGYCMDDMSTADVTQHLITGASGTNLWRPGQAVRFPRNISLYRIDEDHFDTHHGESMLIHLQQVKKEIQRSGIGVYVSKWMVRLIINIVYYCDVKSSPIFLQARNLTTIDLPGPAHKRTQMQMKLLSERINTAIEIFAPGIINKEDLEDLRVDLHANSAPNQLKVFSDDLPRWAAMNLPGCPSHDGHVRGEEDSECDLNITFHVLEAIAWKIWICAHIGTEARVLRDIAPDYLWQLNPPNLRALPGKQIWLTQSIVENIASRLAGRRVRAEDERVIGLAAGGFVVGLLDHEDLPIKDDPGHLLYITPGGIDAPERSVNEVSQHYVHGKRPTVDFTAEPSLKDMLEPHDLFGLSNVRHIVQIEGPQAKVVSLIAFRGGECSFLWLETIDNASFIKQFRGCLSECASGALSSQELSAVEVLGPSNIVALGFLKSGIRLQVVFAHDNTRMIRAVLSCSEAEPVMLQAGTCTHCAVRTALAERFMILVC